MLRIRVKMGPPRSKEWTCCFGLHVRTATIMIGLWHLFLNILALSLLAVIWRNPQMMEELENNYDYTVDLNAPALPTPLSKVDPPYAYRDHSLNYQNFDMGGLVCTCMIAITLMMIYGTIKGKPSHLLPFFCLQLFDFAITTLTAAGYLCYLQSVHRLIAESHRLPWREKLLELSPDALILVVLVTFLGIVFLKAYAIGIVWRCYKYLTMCQHNMRTLLPCVIPDLTGANLSTEERAYSTLLPNYDEAIAQYMKQAPPPSYQVAMSNIPPEDDSAAGAAAGAAAVAGDADNMADNNNDSPNNNNTVHINANNIASERRQSNNDAEEVAVAAAAVVQGDSIPSTSTVAVNGNAVEPPTYNLTMVDLEEEDDDDAAAVVNAQSPKNSASSAGVGKSAGKKESSA